MIPLSEPFFNGNEEKYLQECIRTRWVSTAGPFIKEFEKDFAAFIKSPYALACSSGTAALHLALLAAGIKAGDLVITSDLTYVATVNAIKYCGADPILIDIDKDSWQMDLSLLRKFLAEEVVIQDHQTIHKTTQRPVRAILPVHILGATSDMQALSDLAEEFHLILIEDACGAVGSFFDGQHAGTFGNAGCFSFNGNKIITSGSGGMLVTGDEEFYLKAKQLLNLGKKSSENYFHEIVGYNYRMDNLSAALGKAQLEQLPYFLKKKKEIKDFYDNILEGIPGINFQQNHSDAESNHWLYTTHTDQSNELISHLVQNGITARKFWQSIHIQPPFQKDIYYTFSNISQSVSRGLISLPSSLGLSAASRELIKNSLEKFFSGIKYF